MTQITITLPENCQLKAEKGQLLQKGDQLAVIKGKITTINIDLAKNLKVSPAKTKKYLTIKIGQSVKKDDLIAKKKLLFKKSIEIKSQITGTLKELDLEKGLLVVQGVQKDYTITCPLQAKVSSVSKNTLTLQSKATVYKLKEIIGDSIYGQLKQLTSLTPKSVLEVKDIDQEKDIILIQKAPISVVKKLIALNAKGIIFELKAETEPFLNDLSQYLQGKNTQTSISFIDDKNFAKISKLTNTAYIDKKNSFIAVLDEKKQKD